MKKRFNGKYAGNAETEIDYITGKVTFKHPEKTKNINENLAYFIHNLADIFGLMLGYVFFFIVSFYYKNNIIKNLKFLPLWLSMLISLIMILYLLSMIVVGLIITGYLSVFIHKNNKKVRELYPLTNALPFLIKKRKTIDLRKYPYSKNHYVHDNKLIIFDYSIVYFEFYYEGKNKIINFKTKSVEKKGKKNIHFKFIAIITFKDKIKDGMFVYK